jgi:hypothetical protein
MKKPFQLTSINSLRMTVLVLSGVAFLAVGFPAIAGSLTSSRAKRDACGGNSSRHGAPNRFLTPINSPSPFSPDVAQRCARKAARGAHSPAHPSIAGTERSGTLF